MRITPQRPAAIGLAVGSLALMAGCQASEMPATVGAEDVDGTDSPQSAEVQETDLTGESEATTGPLADGTYSSTGGYQSPNGPETVVVTLSIADGIVTAASVEPQASNATSSRYQGQFAGGIADEVIGKPLAEVRVTRVAGSSLTGGGFNKALEQIRAQAQANNTSSMGSTN